MNDDELNDIRQLIDHMQSGLVELFEQLRELRERLHLVTGLPADMPPSIVPLFSEVKPLNDTVELEPSSDSTKEDSLNLDTNSHSESSLQEITDTTDEKSPITDSSDSSSSNAKVSRVLDPIVRELRTGEATADIILEYLQAAKDYLIDDDEKKVARDMDIVLNFLKARGKRGIRTEERDNILKRIRRWKAHLVS